MREIPPNIYDQTIVEIILAGYNKKAGRAHQLPAGWSWYSTPIQMPTNSVQVPSIIHAVNNFDKIEVYTCYHHENQQVLFVIPGTCNGDDIIKDIHLLLRKSHPERLIRRICQFVKSFNERFPFLSIKMVGHSLGGSIAANVAYKLNLPAMTFEAPGISESPVDRRDDIVNYVMMGPGFINSLHHYPGKIFIVDQLHGGTIDLVNQFNLIAKWHSLSNFKHIYACLQANDIYDCPSDVWDDLRRPLQDQIKQVIDPSQNMQVTIPSNRFGLFAGPAQIVLQNIVNSVQTINRTVWYSDQLMRCWSDTINRTQQEKVHRLQMEQTP